MARIVVASLWTLLVWLLFLTPRAEAQLTDLREHARQVDHKGVALSLESSLFVGQRGGSDQFVAAPSPAMAVRLWEVVLEAAVPIAVARANSVSTGRSRDVRVGNVWMGASYLPDCDCGLSRVSLGVGAPSARANTAENRNTLFLANAAHGAWDSYLWTPDLFPVVAGYQTFMPLGKKKIVRLHGGGDLALGLPGGGRDTEFGMQWAGEASFGRRARFGTQLSGTYWPTFAQDRFQSALSTYLRYGGYSNWIGARFVMNLNSPAGFAFSEDGVWGLHLTYAASL